MNYLYGSSAPSEKKSLWSRSSSNNSQATLTEAKLRDAAHNNRFFSEDEALAKARAEPDDESPLLVVFSPQDPDNPRNWGIARKSYAMMVVYMLVIGTSVCVSGISSASEEISETFRVSSEVTTLGLVMYVLGFAFGPLLLAPLSEYYGRYFIYVYSWFFLFIFQLPVALAPNIGTIIVCRFIQGFGGSAPIVNTGGTIADLFIRDKSGPPMMLFGLFSTCGPPFALVISGYIVLKMGWRWVFWVDMIITGGLWVIMIITLPETRHSTRLEHKVKRMRKTLRKEGNEKAARRIFYGHATEEKSMNILISIHLTRPFRFLFTEPITMGAALYNGFIYGLIFLFNEAFPLVFGPGGHNFNTGEWGLAFLGIVIGGVIAAACHPIQERYYLKRVAANNGLSVPEARMWQSLIGSLFLPISLRTHIPLLDMILYFG
ncbi:MAG: hypothetical protein M1820_007090 [Bogoriella megaspora]|nr:MAG: hypothetical protein M1820_007090 [Bogoriella megaspora]